MSADIRLVYLETSGNQSYIFGTNKLREIIGASEAIYQVGTRFVARAVNRTFGLGVPERPAALADWIADRQTPIEQTGAKAEIIVATSGKALLLVRGEERARALISAWSLSVAAEARGVDATGVFSDAIDMDDIDSMARSMKQVHRRFDEARVLRTSPEARYQMLPIVEPCRTSGLPAAELYREVRLEAEDKSPGVPGSRVTLTKRHMYNSARERFDELLADPRSDVGAGFAQHLDKIAEDWGLEWLAIVHADGNGLGQVFLDFATYVCSLAHKATSRDYVQRYRDFSRELDRATRAAFRTAALQCFTNPIEHRSGRWVLPVVPLIVGGDDVTIVCDGRSALGFTQAFLRAFESELEQGGCAADVARTAFGVKRIGMCAGVAIVKPSFPFHIAYDLAGQLIKEAKKVKQRVIRDGRAYPVSALDYHLVYDSSLARLEDDIRPRLHREKGRVRLYARPFVVTPLRDISQDVSGREWCQHHHVTRLTRAIKALTAQNADGRRALPAARAHAIREALHDSWRSAEEALKVALARHGKDGFVWCGPETAPGASAALFEAEPDGTLTTVFQDALEAIEFRTGLEGIAP